LFITALFSYIKEYKNKRFPIVSNVWWVGNAIPEKYNSRYRYLLSY